jgi:hypothetical protein
LPPRRVWEGDDGEAILSRRAQRLLYASDTIESGFGTKPSQNNLGAENHNERVCEGCARDPNRAPLAKRGCRGSRKWCQTMTDSASISPRCMYVVSASNPNHSGRPRDIRESTFLHTRMSVTFRMWRVRHRIGGAGGVPSKPSTVPELLGKLPASR